MIVTPRISLLKDCPNIVSMSQADVDNYKLSDEQQEEFYDGVKLFSNKATSHITHQYVDFHLKNKFKYLDIVYLPKYPLMAVYNKNTKRCLVNLSSTLKTKVNNIDGRDLYTMIAYAHCCSCLSTQAINSNYYEPFCSYMSYLFLKIFSKKYGITGSYSDLIPQFKYIVSFYILKVFFNIPLSEANKKAESLSKFNSNQLWKNLDPKSYQFDDIRDMIRLLDESGTCPGLGIYRFVDIMTTRFGVMNLSIFQDCMRFCSAMLCSTINSNSFFPPSFQLSYSQQKFMKINDIVTKYL